MEKTEKVERTEKADPTSPAAAETRPGDGVSTTVGPVPKPGIEAPTGSEAAPLPTEDASRQETAHLRSELSRVEHEREAVVRRLEETMRSLSALVNEQGEFRVRLQREKERVLETERGNVALSLLETLDDIDRALAASGGAGGPLAEGVRLIREGLMRRLSAMGIERMALLGKAYDAAHAEVVDLVPVADPAVDGCVVEELQAGYRLGPRVLRPGRVKVGRFSDVTERVNGTNGVERASGE
jgi:molecular chaperone GrpE